MLAYLMILELFVCPTAMLSGWLLDIVHGRWAPTRELWLPGAVGWTEPMEVTMQSTEQTTRDRLAPSGNGHAEVAYALDSRVVADLGGTRVLDEGDARSRQPAKPRPRWGRRLVIGLVVAAVVWAGLTYGAPYVREMLETVQTNDAFVSGHITYVSPRIEDVVTEVLVDQNDRVEPGQLLVRLDRQPFELTVAQNDAALEQARANLVQARAQASL